MDIRYDALYIDGVWRRPATARTIGVVSASTEEPIGAVPAGSPADLDAAVAAARTAFDDPAGWAGWPAADRAKVLTALADALDARRDEMATRISAQNGMPIALSRRVDAPFPGMLLRYYAELSPSRTAEEQRPGAFGRTVVQRGPVGVVAAIVPWNFPQSLMFMKLAPALAAGCAVVVKPSPETVLDAFLVAEAAAGAGLPPGVLNIVPGGRELGAALVAHPGVDKVAFTGSTAAGREIAQVCGRLLRPVTLELGGKSAVIVLDDADLSAARGALFGATLLNNGQACYIGTRVLAPRQRYREVVDVFTELAGSLPVGDALDRATRVGPLVSARQRERVEGYIARGRAEGARVTVGGGRPPGLDRGWFVQPTVFADVDPAATIAREEIFGPVLTVTPYDGEDDAVRLANDSEYGLAGTVWTSDPDRGLAVARRVRTGTIGVNGYTPDLAAPFGGIGASGLGRELGPEGLDAYLQLKSIYC